MDLDELFMSEEEIAAANAIAGLRYLPGVEDIGTPQEPSLLPARDNQTSKEVITDINYDSIKTKYAPPEIDSLEFNLPKTPPEIARAMGEETLPLDELEAMFMPHSDSGEAAEGDAMKTEPSVTPSVTEGSAMGPGVPQSAAGGTDPSSENVANSDYIEAMFSEEAENQQGEGSSTSHVPAESGEVAVSNGETTPSGGIDQQADDQSKSEEASDSFSVQIDSLFRSIADPDHTSLGGFEGDNESVAEHDASMTNGATSGLNAVEYSSGNMSTVLQGMNVTSGQISTSASSAIPVAVENLTDSTQTVLTDLSSFLGLVPGQGNGFNYSSQPSQVYLVSSNAEGTELRNVQGQLVCTTGGAYVTTTIDVTAIQNSGSDDTVRTLNYSSQNEGTVVGQSGKRQRGQNGDEGTPAAKIPRVTDEESGISSPTPQNDTGSRAENGSQRRRAKHNHGPLPILLEKDVGIEAYISPNIKGFSGIIKERYEDFVVHEINEANEVIHLTDLSCPVEEKKKSVDVSNILSEHDNQSLEQLQVSTEKDTYHLIDVTSASKDARTKIHMAIKQNFQNLESSTVELMDSKYVKIVKKSGGGKSRTSRWPKGRPKYCRFVLSKENIDSNEVLALMAKHLHIKPHGFQYAGTKDKRAVTVQEMTIHKLEAEKLAKLNKKLRGVRVGNFRYVEKPLTLGELAGNHFEIILREVSGDQATMEKALKSLKENGFINYFGMQRFGNSTTATHLIGRAVLKNQWEEAVDLILQPRPGDNSPDSAWRQHWMDTKDAKSTLSRLPHDKKLSVEQQLLKSLASSKNDYCQAFSSIPRNARMLYLHSYQSRVWNTVASKRIPKWGLYPSVGDLAARKSINNDKMSWICPEKVCDENLHKYSLEDIVLPLPGHTVHYPENEASTYTEILAQDGLTTDHLRHKIKDYSLPGAYRKLVVKPSSVTWSFIKYDDSKEKLIQSDLDRLEGIPAPVPVEDGKKLALKLSFTLPTSAYATMALRELMKTETSSSHHAVLSQRNKSKKD
ncbi:Pseudouridylate synthase 7-like [Holothuria leucospilota]|uniref:Pseudouridylate synthase 7-like n=1 Tax=Holothuria leucospilota TaxID=206669 RepID=A0A9Q1CME0_HOLLE|nr:Pseudouridylate synthase 7-like [Holothuria leucospilota]